MLAVTETGNTISVQVGSEFEEAPAIDLPTRAVVNKTNAVFMVGNILKCCRGSSVFQRVAIWIERKLLLRIFIVLNLFVITGGRR